MPIQAQRGGEGTAYVYSYAGIRRAPRDGQDVTENLDPAGFDPRIAEAIASRHTDYAIPELYVCMYVCIYIYIYIDTHTHTLNT
jgi:hypothetical protein